MNIGAHIKEIATGDTGTICRIDDRWIFVLLDKNKGDRYYELCEYGPFVARELKLTGGQAHQNSN